MGSLVRRATHDKACLRDVALDLYREVAKSCDTGPATRAEALHGYALAVQTQFRELRDGGLYEGLASQCDGVLKELLASCRYWTAHAACSERASAWRALHVALRLDDAPGEEQTEAARKAFQRSYDVHVHVEYVVALSRQLVEPCADVCNRACDRPASFCESEKRNGRGGEGATRYARRETQTHARLLCRLETLRDREEDARAGICLHVQNGDDRWRCQGWS